MIKTIALYQIQAKEVFKEMRKKAIRQVETTSWLSRQTKSKVMQKLATTKVGRLAKVFYEALVDSPLEISFIRFLLIHPASTSTRQL